MDERAGRTKGQHQLIIDSHVHLFPEEVRRDRERFCKMDRSFATIYEDPKARLASVEDLLGAIDEVGARGAVVCGFPWEHLEIGKDHNDYIQGVCDASDGRLIGLGCISRRLGERGIQEMERCLRMGLAGIGEIATHVENGQSVLHFLEEIAALSARWKRPLLIHATESVGHGYPGKDRTDFQELYRWISTHPNLDVVLAHWGGGLFFYELMPEVREACARVYYDTAASPFLYRTLIYQIAVEIVGFDRILMGSDFPLIHPRRYIQEIKSQDLPGEAIAGILGENAARLWGWPQRT